MLRLRALPLETKALLVLACLLLFWIGLLLEDCAHLLRGTLILQRAARPDRPPSPVMPPAMPAEEETL